MGYNLGIDRITSQLVALGMNKLASTFPRDFEIYMCALELTDYNGDTIDYFSFPIMPSSINKTESEATTITHSLTGVTVMNKDGFTPNDLTIQGNFGRTFKVLFNDSVVLKFKAIQYSIESGITSFSDLFTKNIQKQKELPFGIKTGFGCIKVLQSIIDKAKGYDSAGKNFKLFFYNAALGEAYLVVPTKSPLELSQNENNSNMIWNYTLNLSIVADAKDVSFNNESDNSKYSKSLSNATKSASMQKMISGISSDIIKYIS